MSQMQRRDSAKTEVSFDSAMVKLWKDWTGHYGGDNNAFGDGHKDGH